MLKQTSLLVVAIILIVIAAIGFYKYHVPHSIFSTNTSDWGSFSTYLSLIISSCNLIVFIILSTQLYKYNRDNERPIISFMTLQNHGYFISNVGKGSAINCRIKTNYSSGRWENSFHFHHVYANGKEEQMIWTSETNRIIARYADSLGREYITYMIDETLSIVDLQKWPLNKREREIIRLWKLEPYSFIHRPFTGEPH